MATVTSHADPAPIALILGINGSIGRAVAETLARRGYRIRALVRRMPDTPATPFPIDYRQGDAMRPEDVAAAAAGAAVILHGVNPAGYLNWREEGIPMLANAIEAARRSGSLIAFPGNVYVYGPSQSLVDEAAPFSADTGKGRVRIEMERMLEKAAKEGVRSLTLRAGDFFGPGVGNSWFSQAIAAGGLDAKRLVDPTIGHAGHAWAYMPDLAEAFAQLIERRDALPPYAVFHFGGHWLEDGRAMAEAARKAIGRRDVRIWRFPWALMPVLGLASPFMRELREMRWLWAHPLRLHNARLESVIGPEPHTPLDAAVAAALAGAKR
jgi:nucleoside-diphosphate-sugar epimerase